MEVTVAELKRDLEKYLAICRRERVYVMQDGQVVAMLSGPREARVEIMESLFGCIPAGITPEESGEERLSRI